VRLCEPARSVVGHIAVPGDKSISHRAALLGAVGEGETRISGFGRSGDTESTLSAIRALGAEVDEEDVDLVLVRGVGLRGLAAPDGPVDCGNAGTLLRLLAGLAAGQDGAFTLTGDDSLRARPMKRIAEPLTRMGARVETTNGGAPLTVRGGALHAIDYRLPVASAQVKSAVLLAGLYAEGKTTVVEPAPTRDHTELLLEQAGAPIARRPGSVSVERVERLRIGNVDVPGDFSSAAPFVVAATLLAGSELHVHGVGLNPRRTGLLDVLERMGARITVYNRRRAGREPVGDLEVHSAELVAAEVGADEVPRLVDELPLFALAAACARGRSSVRGAAELRVKESDRVEAVTSALHGLGIRIRAREDGFEITGVPARPRGGRIQSGGDHRIAILGAVAGAVSREGVAVESAEAAAISFPGFWEVLAQVAQRG
jgi:3-phosphoshikimate 1-carboxyvinyltransferase